VSSDEADARDRRVTAPALTPDFRKPKAWATLGAGVLACVARLVAGMAGGGDHEDVRERGGRERYERRLE
jgi:hypothetical protein